MVSEASHPEPTQPQATANMNHSPDDHARQGEPRAEYRSATPNEQESETLDELRQERATREAAAGRFGRLQMVEHSRRSAEPRTEP